MRFLTFEEVGKWCEDRGLAISLDKYLFYKKDKAFCFRLGSEIKASSLIALAGRLGSTPDDIFSGALFWIRERNIWNSFSENVGAGIMDKMRLGRGESKSLKDRPGHLFSNDDSLEMHSYLLMPMLFGWDAFLVQESGDYFVFVSHDGFLGVVCDSKTVYQALYDRVHHWNPQREDEWYLKRIPSVQGRDQEMPR